MVIFVVGGVRKEVVKNVEGGYEEVLVMSVILSCDYCVVDGVVGV